VPAASAAEERWEEVVHGDDVFSAVIVKKESCGNL